MQLGTAAAVALALVLAAPAARAQNPEARAAKLFADGRVLLERGDYAGACPMFEESLALLRRAGTLINMALCAEHAGRLVLASQHWKEAISMLSPSDERVPIATERLLGVEKRLPRLILKPPQRLPERARFVLDGTEIERSVIAAERPLDPGDHMLVVTAPGHSEQHVPIKLEQGDRKEVLIMLGEPAPGSATPGSATPGSATPGSATPALSPVNAGIQQDPAGQSTLRTAGIVVAGAGAVGFVVAAVTGGMLLDAHATVQKDCPGDACTTNAGYEAAQRGQSLLIANTVGWIAGIAGAGAGITMIVLGGKKDPRAAALRPATVAGGPALVLSGRF